MTSCVFCDIIAGKLCASVVFEDEDGIVFADVRQPTEAHLLVVPKEHVETLDAMPLDGAARLMQLVVLTARAITAAIRPAGLSVWQSNGMAAGQEVPHVHVHVLARQPADGLLQVYAQKPARPDRNALDQIAATIKAAFVKA